MWGRRCLWGVLGENIPVFYPGPLPQAFLFFDPLWQTQRDEGGRGKEAGKGMEKNRERKAWIKGVFTVGIGTM